MKGSEAPVTPAHHVSTFCFTLFPPLLNHLAWKKNDRKVRRDSKQASEMHFVWMLREFE